MNFQSIIEIILNFILAPAIFIFSITGNILGLTVFIRQHIKLSLIAPIRIYKSLFVFNSMHLIQLVLTLSSSSMSLTNFNIATLSSMACKLTTFCRFVFNSFAPYFLIYISIEKYISIKNKEKMYLLKNEFFQFLYILGLLFLNGIIYIVLALVSSDLKIETNANKINNNSSLITKQIVCDFTSAKIKLVTTYFDIIIRFVIPTLILLYFSFSLFQLKIVESTDRKEKRRLQKEIQYAISTVIMNMTYIAFNLPVVIVTVLESLNINISNELSLFIYYLYFLAYGCFYYAKLIFNPSFKNESLNTLVRKNNIQANESLEMTNTISALGRQHLYKNSVIHQQQQQQQQITHT